MNTKNVNDETGQSPEDDTATSGGSDGQSDAQFGHLMEASAEEAERYADSEDTDSEEQQLSTDGSGIPNTPGGLGAFGGSSRHS